MKLLDVLTVIEFTLYMNAASRANKMLLGCLKSLGEISWLCATNPDAFLLDSYVKLGTSILKRKLAMSEKNFTF